MRLYFHLFDGTEQILDAEGLEVNSLDDAQGAIEADLDELKREFPADLRQGWALNIVDGSGAILLSIPLEGSTH
jgi:hypothetical protein